jgi:hypothetical protein
MAEQIVSLRRDDDVTSITIPERYAKRFRHEAEFDLGSAAQTVHEASEWNGKAKDRGEHPKRPISEADISRFEDSARVFRQVRRQKGELHIEGAVKVLRSCAHGVLLDVTQEIQAQAEALTPDFAPVMAEFDFWRELRERLDGEAVS